MNNAKALPVQEQRQRRMDSTDKLLDDAYRIYMADVDPEKAQEAFEPIIDACRKLLKVVRDQQEQIEELQKTVRNHLSEVV